jgi:hypothetical protein
LLPTALEERQLLAPQRTTGADVKQSFPIATVDLEVGGSCRRLLDTGGRLAIA